MAGVAEVVREWWRVTSASLRGLGCCALRGVWTRCLAPAGHAPCSSPSASLLITPRLPCSPPLGIPAPDRHDTSLAVLSSLDSNMQSYKAQCDEARAAQTALTKKVDWPL